MYQVPGISNFGPRPVSRASSKSVVVVVGVLSFREATPPNFADERNKQQGSKMMFCFTASDTGLVSRKKFLEEWTREEGIQAEMQKGRWIRIDGCKLHG